MSGIGKGGIKRAKPVNPPRLPGQLSNGLFVWRKKLIPKQEQFIGRPSIRRLARRAGCIRVNVGVYNETRKTLREYMEKVLHDTVEFTKLARRKTVTAMDVVMALKFRGQTLYGFGA